MTILTVRAMQVRPIEGHLMQPATTTAAAVSKCQSQRESYGRDVAIQVLEQKAFTSRSTKLQTPRLTRSGRAACALKPWTAGN